MSLPSGTRLGPYEIVAPLGAGGMGEVYRARDTRLDRTVAVKILPSHLSSDPTLRQRFEQKGRLGAYLEAIPSAVIVHSAATFLGLRSLAVLGSP